MSKYQPEYTSHGNYKCSYCNHKVWKTSRAAENHIKEYHQAEAEQAYHIKREDALERENSRLKEQLKRKDEYLPTLKYDPPIVMFCTYCKTIFKGSLPAGFSIETVRHSVCNNTTLHIVSNPPMVL